MYSDRRGTKTTLDKTFQTKDPKTFQTKDPLTKTSDKNHCEQLRENLSRFFVLDLIKIGGWGFRDV